MKPIPKSLRVNTGDQINAEKTINDFFKDTKEFVEKNYKSLRHFPFEIKHRTLTQEPQKISTDDLITYLIYENTPIANVLSTRDDMNYVIYTFFRNLQPIRRYKKHL